MLAECDIESAVLLAAGIQSNLSKARKLGPSGLVEVNTNLNTEITLPLGCITVEAFDISGPINCEKEQADCETVSSVIKDAYCIISKCDIEITFA